MRIRQQGYVLLQVMFVFAILVVIITQVQYSQRIQIERTSYSLFLSQAQAYSESAEAIAEVGLTLDTQNSENDHLYELWNTSEGVFPLDDGGLIELELNDLQGRFNLNWLSKDNANRESALKAFQQLLLLIESKSEIATELNQWFDAESGIDYFYSDELPSYAPSYTAMADTSELMLLKSVSFEDYDKLKPYVSALPADSPLNINTAPQELLQIIANNLSEEWASDAVSQRGETGYSSVTDLINQEIFKTSAEAGQYLENLSVTSNWFELYTAVTLGDKTLRQRTIIYRNDNGGTNITLRDRSALAPNRIPGDPVKEALGTDSNDQSSDQLNNGSDDEFAS